MLRTHRRKTALTAAALLATTALLTSCGGSDDSDDKKSNSSSSSKESKESKKDSGGGESKDDGKKDGTNTQSGSDSGQKTGGKGVNGTWFGNVEYMAPGKYTVSDMKGKKQQFFTSTNTDIQGTGDICGDENGQAAKPCTETELEAAAKKGFTAKVTLKGGTAVSIVDDHSGSGGEEGGSDKGVNGTWFGNVEYMAPGKYTVSDMKGKKQQFFTSTNTDIQGTGDICGDENGQAAKPCTETELEAAAKKGFTAKVTLKGGTAVSIVDDHS